MNLQHSGILDRIQNVSRLQLVTLKLYTYTSIKEPDDEGKYLIPTRATLFGLDVRFRAIDKKMEDEKSKYTHYCE